MQKITKEDIEFISAWLDKQLGFYSDFQFDSSVINDYKRVLNLIQRLLGSYIEGEDVLSFVEDVMLSLQNDNIMLDLQDAPKTTRPIIERNRIKIETLQEILDLYKGDTNDTEDY